ncbi:MAG: hypothetical protein GXO24_03820 [Chlorobi bacterium]|nr:hypothetical protein [Chlorobiota bacterium]
MNRRLLLALKYNLLIIAVLWIFYFTGLISLGEARGFTIGALIGGVLAYLFLRLLGSKFRS